MKTCKRCTNSKINSEFSRTSDSKDGYKNICKSCTNSYRRTYRKNNPEKTREAKFKERYGITFKDWDKMYKDQNGKCAICDAYTNLCVDHSHQSGKVRGLLCRNCNTALGLVKDDIIIVAKALKYLYERK